MPSQPARRGRVDGRGAGAKLCAVSNQRDELRETLRARGIAEDAAVGATLGRGAGVRLPRISAFPRAPDEAASSAAFSLREEIGRGGMATVWSALQSGLGREVAVKRVSDESDPEAAQLLLREAMVAGQLEHPNIVPIHQLVVDAQGPAVVMKRIAGRSWDSLIDDPQVGLETHLTILLQTLNAVGFAHSRQVLHRDIKPQNVMIGDFGEVYLLDWGVAKLADDPASNTIVGTPCYMAPEMADGHADERTDVFLLGATLHEVLTGEPRHLGESALDVLYAAMYVEPYVYSPDVSRELAEICNRACARAPEERFQSVTALRAAVLRFQEHRAANALTDSAAQLLSRLLSRTTSSEFCSRASTAHGDWYTEAQRLFGETRLGYEAALRVWPASPAAQAGLARCLGAMVEYELGLGHLEPAEALHAQLPAPDLALSQKLAALREARSRERARLLRIERDRDPSVGALERTRAYLGMGAVTALMTLALVARRVLLPEQGLSTLRLTLVGAGVLAIMLAVALLWRRAGPFNLINQRIVQISVSTLAVSFASRLSGHLTETAPERVLISDAFILGLGGILLSPYHPAGPWLAGLSFAVAAVGSVLPALVDDLFIALSVLVPAALLLLKRGELRPRADPTVESVSAARSAR
jgi:eukaryotic-like serine/threonine-protein kinase